MCVYLVEGYTYRKKYVLYLKSIWLVDISWFDFLPRYQSMSLIRIPIEIVSSSTPNRKKNLTFFFISDRILKFYTWNAASAHQTKMIPVIVQKSEKMQRKKIHTRKESSLEKHEKWTQRRVKWTMDKTPVEVDNKMFHTFWDDDEARAHDTN